MNNKNGYFVIVFALIIMVLACIFALSGCASFKANSIAYKDPNGLVVAEVNSPDYFAIGKNISVDLNKGTVKSESAGFWESVLMGIIILVIGG